MKKRHVNLWAILFLIIITSCGKDDGAIIEEPTKSNAKQITTFLFRADINTALEMDINASINETSKVIAATMPYGTDVSALKPEISVSEKAEANNSSFNDFSSIVKLMVTAEDGSTVIYDVIITVELNNANNILSFAFSITDNPIGVTIVGQIDNETKTITFETPLGTDISVLLPQIQVSVGSTISPEGYQDFNSPIIFIVTAEDGTEQEYTAIWKISQRDILLTLYNDNPESTLDWDIEDQDISNWDGVTTDEMGNAIELNLIRKDIRNLPEVIGRFPELSILILESNLITEIPSSIGNLTKLTYLSLEGNQIAQLPTEVGLLNSLQRLNLNSNLLEEIPVETGQLTNLRSLNLSFNALTTLPSELGQLTNLTFLGISSNQMTDLPSELDQIKVAGLDLSNNKFESVPSSVFRMSNLKSLRITFCPLKSLPPSISEAKKLETLRIEYTTEILSLPTEIDGLESLKRLSIANTRLANLPASIGELTNLEVLDLAQVGLPALPLEIGNLKNLKALDVTGGSLRSLPSEIGSLLNLEELYLANNQLTDIPESIGKLKNLFTLSLNGNQISGGVPLGITKLSNLESLSISQNKIDQIPIAIRQMKSLLSLGLSRNEITTIPTEISDLTQLTRLFLSDNQLTAVPEEMGLLTNLTSLTLHGNPNLLTVPQAVCALRDTGTEVTLSSNTICVIN